MRSKLLPSLLNIFIKLSNFHFCFIFLFIYVNEDCILDRKRNFLRPVDKVGFLPCVLVCFKSYLCSLNYAIFFTVVVAAGVLSKETA